MKPLVIFGSSEIAELAHFYFEHEKLFRVVAFTVDDQYVQEGQFCGLPVVPYSEVAKKFKPSEHFSFAALSYQKMNTLRADKYKDLKTKGYRIATYVSSKCTNFSKEIGENCFILEDNTIQPFVKIGNNVTMWSGNHIGHHSTIKDNCFLTSHVVVSGGVVIEENAFLGVNSTLRDHIKVGQYALIGAGSTVVEDVAPRAVYVGTKAKATGKDSLEIQL